MNIDGADFVRDPVTTDLSDILVGYNKTGDPYEESNGTWTFPYQPEVLDSNLIARVKLRLTSSVEEEQLYYGAYNVLTQLQTIQGTAGALSTATLSDIVRLYGAILEKLIPLTLTKFEFLLEADRP